MLTRFGRRGCPHRRESCRSPKRIGTAGVGEEDLLEAILVAGRGSGEVEGWCLVEGKLGVAIYSRPEAVAENWITSTSDYDETVVGQVAADWSTGSVQGLNLVWLG